MTREALLRATVTALGMHNLAPDDAGSGPGWTARRDALVNDAGTVLATAENSIRTPYTKNNDGQAICLIVENANRNQFGGYWCFVVVISTVQEYMQMSVPHAGQFISAYEYEGILWYVGRSGQNASNGGAITLNTPYPKLDFAGANLENSVVANMGIPESAFLRLMQAAGIQLVPRLLDRPVLTAGRV